LEGNPNDAVKLQKCFESNKKQIWNYDNNVILYSKEVSFSSNYRCFLVESFETC